MFKVQQLSLLTAATAMVLLPYPAFAQARPDSRGDYYSWGGSWIVAINSGSLNCRSGPGTNYRIITRFPKASYLATASELEGNPIEQDRQGRPWVRIKWAGTSTYPCFVRANMSFIGSMDGFDGNQSNCINREIRKGRSFPDAAFDCVD
ncbi:SH3 domain-containing protein [Trichocoleus desertorum AS-A10]|uniref:SH3 domain-containing protein n=1 Tax=Trichocoleus desertorum TaxID=1481672 RepID=UPI003299FCC6